MDITRNYLERLKFSEQQINRTLLMYELAKDISENGKAGLILKGGTALLFCYNLARYSTDLDYDGTKYDFDISNNIRNVMGKNGYSLEDINLKKNTDTVKRFMVHYAEEPNNPLKIEISFRNMEFISQQDCVTVVNGIKTYKIDFLAEYKAETFITRMKARDVYDIAFLLKNYPYSVSDEMAAKCHEKVKTTGIDYMEKLLKDDEVLKLLDPAKILISLEDCLKNRIGG